MASTVTASQLEKGESLQPFPSYDCQQDRATTSTGSTLTDGSCWLGHVRTLLAHRLSGLKIIPRAIFRPNSRDLAGQRRMHPTTIRRLHDFPTGFPKVSCFLDSDDAFMLYRRFGTVFSRLLLSKQDEMRCLEATLNGMDKTDEADGNKKYLESRTLDVHRDDIPHTWKESRTALIEKIEKKALEYAELLLKAQQLKALDRPTNRDYKSVLHFMENDGGPLGKKESQFIYEKEDLVTLRPDREYAWLDGALERVLHIFRCRLLLYLFQSKETREKTNDETIHYYDRNRISTCTTMIITVVVLALLVIPIWLLYKFSVAGTISTPHNALGVVFVFTLIFSAAVTIFTKARRHEIVAASAG